MTATEIAAAVVAAGVRTVDKRRIEVAQAIKSTGDYTVQVRLHPEVAAKVTVKVVAA